MPSDLWRFAEDLYQRPGVEAACLHLQSQGADICLLLCGAWLGRRGVSWNAERAECLRNGAQFWQREVVSVLRHVRQAWRTAAHDDSALAALREQVKQLELAAERVQLQRLASLSDHWPTRAAEDLHCWLEALTPLNTAADRDALEQLRAAALQL
ncbi:TIGR02444 family protein [Pseudomonas sp. UBA2684]|uniref:TIGR02444 family protein n=1 Tax=Pseudomonas sp. UBA2684 TaxID=1947311 RepID=UPI000E91E691|nr:TIGR02444 family protein [Pseudomonas sp. UBA2684]HBX57414.1 TIGR02444 family protein [Pseudomonas sp.]|tara:strand:- start:10611 stop:11075 length:465 start_codon:yes stop_codon:yes gene_type:complete